MICAWKELLDLLPPWIRYETEEIGSEQAQEIRLYAGGAGYIMTARGRIKLNKPVKKADLTYCVNAASRYSPWSSTTAAKGYITASGGHRVGICGDAVISSGIITGVSDAYSLCIRIAKDFPGIAASAKNMKGSILILGKPGTGKTTLLRDLIRQFSMDPIAVIDEKRELFPMFGSIPCFACGDMTDVMAGAGKRQGIDAVLRNMGPRTIAVDEITAAEDCEALMDAAWCGVRLFATAHAEDTHDLKSRKIYRSVVESGLFENCIILRQDKSWYYERICV